MGNISERQFAGRGATAEISPAQRAGKSIRNIRRPEGTLETVGLPKVFSFVPVGTETRGA